MSFHQHHSVGTSNHLPVSSIHFLCSCRYNMGPGKHLSQNFRKFLLGSICVTALYLHLPTIRNIYRRPTGPATPAVFADKSNVWRTEATHKLCYKPSLPKQGKKHLTLCSIYDGKFVDFYFRTCLDIKAKDTGALFKIVVFCLFWVK